MESFEGHNVNLEISNLCLVLILTVIHQGILTIMIAYLLFQGAWWGLMIGLIIGVIRMGIAVSYSSPVCGIPGEDTRPDILTKVHYLHFAIILGVCSAIVVVAVSIMTPPRPDSKVRARTRPISKPSVMTKSLIIGCNITKTFENV